ncbi:MAG: winged helix-turn-helix domain-containing protein [Lachnospiraceae bacterium]|nr:winged helix-turn-helix domain-containing protein [Lachnospiraceae bacterium]
MKLKITRELDEIWETMELLNMYCNPEMYTKEKYDQNLLEYGMKGSKLLEDAYFLTERYFEAFSEKAVVSEEDSFFFSNKDAVFGTSLHLIFGLLFHANTTWLDGLSDVLEVDIRDALAEALLFEQTPTSASQVIAYLNENEVGLSPELCWKITLVFEKPKVYVEKYLNVLHKNLDAFHFAIHAMKKDVDILLDQFMNMKEETFIEEIRKVATFLPEGEIEVCPAMATVGGIVCAENTVYMGLCYPEICKYLNQLNEPQEDIAPILKVLGDNSKFEILKLLRKAPSYNLEIAKHLGITPATASHHMNVLFGLGLVSMEKINKKAMYTANEEMLRKVMDGMERAFEMIR